MEEKNVVDLAIAIDNTADLLHSILKEKGYRAFRFEHVPANTIQVYVSDIENPRFMISLALYHIVTESEGGMRVEVYFPVTERIERIIGWIMNLPAAL